METGQIIILTVLAVLASISFFGVNFIQNKPTRMLFSILWLVVTSLLFVVIITLTPVSNQKYKECPKLEKVENVYKIVE